MKKSIKVILMSVIILSSFILINAAELPLRVVLDQTTLTFPDAQPFIDTNGRTQTPARFIGESLGAEVEWDAAAQKATFTKGDTVLVITIGQTTYTLNNVLKTMDTKAIIKDQRTFVPARYISEAFGATVKWDGTIRTVYIYPAGVYVPVVVETKDPIYGWIVVSENRADVEYALDIDWDPDTSLVLERLEAAQAMLAERYGEAIAKEVFDYLRAEKVTRQDRAEMKYFKMGEQEVSAAGGSITYMVKVWKK